MAMYAPPMATGGAGGGAAAAPIPYGMVSGYPPHTAAQPAAASGLHPGCPLDHDCHSPSCTRSKCSPLAAGQSIAELLARSAARRQEQQRLQNGRSDRRRGVQGSRRRTANDEVATDGGLEDEDDVSSTVTDDYKHGGGTTTDGYDEREGDDYSVCSCGKIHYKNSRKSTAAKHRSFQRERGYTSASRGPRSDRRQNPSQPAQSGGRRAATQVRHASVVYSAPREVITRPRRSHPEDRPTDNCAQSQRLPQRESRRETQRSTRSPHDRFDGSGGPAASARRAERRGLSNGRRQPGAQREQTGASTAGGSDYPRRQERRARGESRATEGHSAPGMRNTTRQRGGVPSGGGAQPQRQTGSQRNSYSRAAGRAGSSFGEGSRNDGVVGAASPADAVSAIRAMRDGTEKPASDAGLTLESRSTTPSIQPSDLDRSWDRHPRLMRAVRTEAKHCPDHIQAHAATFRNAPISPFALYYHDETAPNAVILARDLKGGAGGDRNEESRTHRVVKGEDYGDEPGDGDTDGAGASGGRRGNNSGGMRVQNRGLDDSQYYVNSYYTASAFTTVSANAMARPLLQLQQQQLQQQLQQAQQATAKLQRSRGCCGLRRQLSASTLPGALLSNYGANKLQVGGDAAAGPEDLTGGAAGAPDVDEEHPISASQVPTAATAAARGVFFAPPSSANNPGNPASQQYPRTVSEQPQQYYQAGGPADTHSNFLQQAYAQVAGGASQGNYYGATAAGGGDGGGGITRYSKVRQTNYVDYTPPAKLAARYGHPAYEEAVAEDRRRQAETAGLGIAVYPLCSHASPCEADPPGAGLRQQPRGLTSGGGAESRGGDRDELRRHKERRGRRSIGGAAEGEEYDDMNDNEDYCDDHEDDEGYHPRGDGDYERMCPTCRRAYESDPSWCPKEGSCASSGMARLQARPRAVHAALREKFQPPKTPEKSRETGYHVRKHFFNAKNAEVPAEGSPLKQLPQYTVSYKNYPNVAFDAIVPEKHKDFFVQRSAPRFFLP